MSLTKLIEKAKSISFDEEAIQEREDRRVDFINKFPLDSIAGLSLEEFSQGNGKDSFCYWLEFKKVLFGIGGANASKFGLYRGKDGKYYTGFYKTKRILDGQELESHFSNLKSGILKALKLTEQNQVEKIRTEISIPMWNMVLQKILAIYYPEKFITVGASDVLVECAKDLKVNSIDLSKENSIYINYECRKKINHEAFFNNWGHEKIGTLIWKVYLDESKRNYFIIGSKYGLQNDVDVFPTLLKRSVVATGFASNLDLSDFYLEKQSTIAEYLKEKGEESKSYSALKHFLSLKEGDWVAIKSDGSPKGSEGFLSIVGIAEVVEKDGKIYEFDPNGLGHLINVKFIKAPIYKEFSIGGYGRTIHKLSKDAHIQEVFKSDYDLDFRLEKFRKWLLSTYKKAGGERLTENSVVNYISAIKNIDSDLQEKNLIKKQSLFQISKVSEIVAVQNAYFSREEIIKKNNSANNRYSASYQRYIDFMESEENSISNPLSQKQNIKPMNYNLNTILYGPPGTGKTYNTINRAAEIIEERTIESYDEAQEVFNKHLGNRIEFITFHQNYSYEDFIEGLRPDVDSRDNLSFERKDGVFKRIANKALLNLENSKAPTNAKRDFIEVFTEFTNPLVEGEKDEIEVPMKQVSFFVNGVTNKSIEFRKNKGDSQHSLSIETLRKMYEKGENDTIKGGLQPYYDPLLRVLLEKGKTNAKPVKKQNYVIVIDEINRANISRVFGELITLIEPDKRSHGKIPLKCTLPSGEEFIVPSNLYIIGTMNTADKSIALLDIALRRRFEFVPMYPKYSGSDFTIHDSDLLKKINEQVIKGKGYDFQIGHSYFMGEDYDLETTMNRKVIPLLLEYYMNDDKEVKTILKNAGLEIDESVYPMKIKGKE